MIVSYYCCHGFADESGLFCTDCNMSFSVDFNFFLDDDFQPIKDVFCPYCGKSCLYPHESIEESYQNYIKYKDFI